MFGLTAYAEDPFSSSGVTPVNVLVVLSSVNQANTATGNVSVTGGATGAPVNVAATTFVGNVSVTGDASLTLTGVLATTADGDVTVSAAASTLLTGVSATDPSPPVR